MKFVVDMFSWVYLAAQFINHLDQTAITNENAVYCFRVWPSTVSIRPKGQSAAGARHRMYRNMYQYTTTSLFNSIDWQLVRRWTATAAAWLKGGSKKPSIEARVTSKWWSLKCYTSSFVCDIMLTYLLSSLNGRRTAGRPVLMVFVLVAHALPLLGPL